MGKKAKDLTGVRFGKLLVVKRQGSQSGSILWLCKCDCGNFNVVNGGNLRSGRVVSCGCYALEVRTKHGRYKHPLFFTWINIIRRCGNPEHGELYAKTWVFSKWRESIDSFINYVDRVLGPKPSKQHTIDRINNLGHYIPGNIRWASKEEQSNNRRSVRVFDYNGETGTVRHFARKYGINFNTLRTRLQRGMPLCQVLQEPLSEQHAAASNLRFGRARAAKAVKGA